MTETPVITREVLLDNMQELRDKIQLRRDALLTDLIEYTTLCKAMNSLIDNFKWGK